MKVKRILLTGDDGYNSIGIRTLVHFLKTKYELAIAGTLNQQSGVGGHLSLQTGGQWGEAVVDGVPAFWTDGYPGDVVECAQGYFKKPFDLIIAGMNLGLNIGSNFSSGTIAAAIRALNMRLAPKAIMLSWDVPASFWYKKHDGNEDLSSYISYPGEAMDKLIALAIKKDLWKAQALNINFPAQPSKYARFTRPLEDFTKYYIYPIYRDKKTMTYSYEEPVEDGKSNLTNTTLTKGMTTIDTGAVLDGYISISPIKIDMLDEVVYAKVAKEELVL